MMQIYLVGGAVRDQLLNRPVAERDYVVVGATAAEMQALGYRQVGKDFPVFLHPTTHAEYALARIERKVKPGYTGFTVDSSPTVTLAEDLERRDLTINAMAQDLVNGKIIDPFHGQEDLQARILRHVSPAFNEDPVRILRVARFFARYANLGFKIAPETLERMQSMVTAGEVEALVPERVWKELQRALTEPQPTKFFIALGDCTALPILWPEIVNLDRSLATLQAAANISDDAIIRFAAFFASTLSDRQISAIAQRLRTPKAYGDLALLSARLAQKFLTGPKEATTLMAYFQQLDIYRRHDRYEAFLCVCTALGEVQNITFDLNWFREAAAVVRSFDLKDLLAATPPQQLASTIFAARLAKLAKWLSG